MSWKFPHFTLLPFHRPIANCDSSDPRSVWSSRMDNAASAFPQGLQGQCCFLSDSHLFFADHHLFFCWPPLVFCWPPLVFCWPPLVFCWPPLVFLLTATCFSADLHLFFCWPPLVFLLTATCFSADPHLFFCWPPLVYFLCRPLKKNIYIIVCQ